MDDVLKIVKLELSAITGQKKRKEKEEERIIQKIVDTKFRCNAQGQHTHFAWTNFALVNSCRIHVVLFKLNMFHI